MFKIDIFTIKWNGREDRRIYQCPACGEYETFTNDICDGCGEKYQG